MYTACGEMPLILCETSLILCLSQERKLLFVNETVFMIQLRVHFLVSTNHTHLMRNIMWLPTPIYERVPQFWFLLGLLFTANGLYLGFEFTLAFWYFAIGLSCCAYSMGLFLERLRHRKSPQLVDEFSAPADLVPSSPAPEESEHAEPAHAE